MVAEDPRRTEIADQITAYLRAGISVHLVGLRSSGRSGLLQCVVELLSDEGVSAAQIRGIRALQDRPLAALAVAGTKVNPAPHQLQLMASAVAALECQLSTGSSALVVDDADDLDTMTVGAIIAAQARLRVPVVFSSRPQARHDNNVDMLTAAIQPAVRVTSPPLRFDEVHQLVHELLGGPVDPTAVAMIATVSGGLPGLVRAVVDAGRRSNQLVLREGLWAARGDLWTPALIAAVEPLLSDLDETALDTLTTLAVGGAMSLDRARRVSSPQALADLDDAGLLQILPVADQDMVGVFPPLVGEFVTRARSAAHRVVAAERLSAVPEAPSPAASGGNPLGLPGGEPILSHRLAQHWAATLARRRYRWEADPSPVNGAALIEALAAIDARPYEFDAVVAGTRTTHAEPGAVAGFLAAALLAALVRGERATVADLLATDHDPQFDGLFRAAEQHVRVLTGEALSGGDLTEDVGTHQVSRDAQRVVRAETLVARGDGRNALAVLDGFSTTTARLQHSADVASELAMIEECRLDEAIRSARAATDRARCDHDAGAIQAHAYAAAVALTLQGRLVEVVQLTSSALALAPIPLDGKHFQTGLLTLGAHAAILEGRVDYAHSLARQAEGMGDHDGPLPGMDPALLGAAIDVGENFEAATELWKVTERRLAAGYLPAAMASGVASVERHPDRDRAELLAEAAVGSASPLFRHMADYAVAISSGDPARLAEIVPRLTRAGLRVYAVHGAVAEAIGLRRTGRRAEAAALTHAVWTQAGLRGRDLCGLYTAYDREVNLSARERQIAVLVARGLSPGDIASRMVLSVRTVENHILHACHKIGVDNREGLAWAACSWLTCTPR